MTFATLAALVGGLLFLAAGAEALVRGATGIARALGVSPLVIGLTVVAYGTSTPELIVSTYASLEGNRDIAVANVVGSNILNVLLILGMCAVIHPLVVAQQFLVREVPIMIGVSLIVVLWCLDGQLGPFEGAFLLAGMVVYTVLAIRLSRRESAAVREEYDEAFGRARGAWPVNVLWVVVGLAGLVQGARWLVQSAIAIAQAMGVSDLVIGLTIVAAGTSLPEVAASIVATLRGERDIAIGNVVGSNIYNLLAILGLASVLAPGGLVINQAVISFDLPVMLAVAVACLPLFFTEGGLSRWEGAAFLGYYAAYVAYVILAAQQHDTLPVFSTVMLTFVIPITVVTVMVVVWRGLQQSGHGRTAR